MEVFLLLSHFLLPSSWTKMPWRLRCAAAGYYYIHVFWISAHYNQKHEKKYYVTSNWPIQCLDLLEQSFQLRQRSWYVQKGRHYCSSKQFLFDWRSSKEIPILCKRARVLTKYTDTLPSCKELFRSSVVTSVSNTYGANALTKPLSWSWGPRWVSEVIRLC